MSLNSVKGYTLVVVSGLGIFAAVLLLVLQWGNIADFSLYGRNVQVNTALLVGASAVGGVALMFICKLMVVGVLALRKSRKKTAPHVDN